MAAYLHQLKILSGLSKSLVINYSVLSLALL